MASPQPHIPYLVCATPRSGSTLLCELLTATGVAGRPAEHFEHLYATNQPRQAREYFDGISDPEVLELLRPTEPGTPESAEAWEERLHDALRDGMTPNGVWASKLMWGYLLDFLRRLRERPQTADLKPAEAIETLLPGVRYVHVRRQDKLAQAISLWTAVQTLAWRDEGEEDGGHDPVYSRAGIAHLLDQLTAQDQAWTSWFATAGIQPIVIAYEDFADDQRGTIAELLRDLHVDTHGAVEIPDPGMRRQAGGRSQEWAERFKNETGAVAP
jgi:LPS sulfotransferase NodH